MSSSRVQTSFTGSRCRALRDLAPPRARSRTSGSRAGRSCRRRSSVLSLHLLGRSARAPSRAPWSTVWNCSPFQISRRPPPSSHDAVQRLHRGVREERELVGRFDGLRRALIAGRRRHPSRHRPASRELLVLRHDSADETLSRGSSHSTVSASRPFFAAQKSFARPRRRWGVSHHVAHARDCLRSCASKLFTAARRSAADARPPP